MLWDSAERMGGGLQFLFVLSPEYLYTVVKAYVILVKVPEIVGKFTVPDRYFVFTDYLR